MDQHLTFSAFALFAFLGWTAATSPQLLYKNYFSFFVESTLQNGTTWYFHHRRPSCQHLYIIEIDSSPYLRWFNVKMYFSPLDEQSSFFEVKNKLLCLAFVTSPTCGFDVKIRKTEMRAHTNAYLHGQIFLPKIRKIGRRSFGDIRHHLLRQINSTVPCLIWVNSDLSFCARRNHVFFAKKIERSKITFTTNGKSEFCTPWPSSPFLAVDFSLLLHRQKLIASRQSLFTKIYRRIKLSWTDKERTDWCKTIFFSKY